MRRPDFLRIVLCQGGFALSLAAVICTTGCSSSTTTDKPAAVSSATRSPSTAPSGSGLNHESVSESAVETKESSANQPAETAATETAAPAKPKTGRDPIYDPAADARADIKAALARAAYDHKRVLVKFGGNWCGWCFRLHDVFKKNRDISPIINSEYELVLVDVNSNPELLKELDPENHPHSYPWLTVLDADGKVLTNQNTGDLEEGPQHDPAKVKAFLVKWQAEPLDADEVLTRGLEQARAEQKRVLVHFGAPGCGWCRVLDRFLVRQHEILDGDYVDVKIDTDRMIRGKEIAGRLRKETSQGIPWLAILDAEGTPVVTSDGPSGNIGYPMQPKEIEHFLAMLRQTRQKTTDEQLDEIERQLRSYAAERARVN